MQQEQDAPRAFISHTHADKGRFVTEFATKLRENGVDAWVDEWELMLGDSLTERILGSLATEGAIAQSDVFIVVVSKNSIESNWVNEELGHGLLRKMQGKSRLIPIILDRDEIEVPPVLNNTVWEEVSDTTQMNEVVSKVVGTIFDIDRKPPLGPRPGFTGNQEFTIPGLSDLDNRVFFTIYDDMFQQCAERDAQPDLSRFLEEVGPGLLLEGLSKDQIADAIEILQSKGLIEVTPVGGEHRYERFGSAIDATLWGMERYLVAKLDDFDMLKLRIAAFIVNEQPNNVVDLRKRFEEENPMALYAVIKRFEHDGWLRIGWTFGFFHGQIDQVSAHLRRFVQANP